MQWTSMELTGAPSSKAANELGNENGGRTLACGWKGYEDQDDCGSEQDQAAHWLQKHALIMQS